jgi:CRISPR-associated protein Cas2
MNDKQFWVVVYDISSDRQRTRLHKVLLDFGTPVQYSVFECWVTPKEFKRLRARVNRVIRPNKDHVRYYFLCAACAGRVETTRAGELTRVPSTLVV